MIHCFLMTYVNVNIQYIKIVKFDAKLRHDN